MPNAPAEFLLPENAGLLTRIRVGLRALRHLKHHPDDPVAGPALNSSFDLSIYDRLIAEMRETGEGRRLLRERPSLQGPDLDLEALERLPEGTLGRGFAGYFRANGIQPFHTTFEIRNDRDYIGKRYRETHDLAHVLTGYATDVRGEMHLQAFAQGNLGIRSALVILSMSVPLMALQRRLPGVTFTAFVAELRAARDRGAAAQSLLTFPFEQYFESPLEEVRARYFAPRGELERPLAA